MRDSSIQKRAVSADLNAESILKTDLLDGQVKLHILQFAAKRDFLGVYVLQNAAEQIAETGEHLLRLICFFLADQNHDGVQSVKEEMRLKLRVQCAELGLDQLRFQFGRLQ